MSFRRIIGFAAVLVSALHSAMPASPAVFVPLGDLPGGATWSTAFDVSADGRVVAGTSESSAGHQAVLWTDGVAWAVPFNEDLVPKEHTSVSLSRDGREVDVTEQTDELCTFCIETFEAARFVDGVREPSVLATARSEDLTEWARLDVFGDQLGFIYFRMFTSFGEARVDLCDDTLDDLLPKQFTQLASGGGAVLGRTDTMDCNSHEPGANWAFVHRPTGTTLYDGLESRWTQTRLEHISGDGTHLGGSATTLYGPEGFWGSDDEGFTLLRFLITLPGSLPSVSALSYDGLTVAGDIQTIHGRVAYVWHATAGGTLIGDLPGGAYESRVVRMSDDGHTVVLLGENAHGPAYFVWTPSAGKQALHTLLAGDPDFTGWTLDDILDITPDGRVLVGAGTNPQGDTEAFAIELHPLMPPVPLGGWAAALLPASLAAIGTYRLMRRAARPASPLGAPHVVAERVRSVR